MSEVARLFTEFERGEGRAAEELLPLLYDELRRLAAVKLAQEKPGQTLQATALVHEAWLRLAGGSSGAAHPEWDGPNHFFAAAAEAMRRILVESARRKMRLRHGGALDRIDSEEVNLPLALPSEDLLALDEALNDLTRLDPEAASLVKLRFYAGLTENQAAEALGISRRSATRMWGYARAWLYRAIRPDPPAGR